MESGRAARRCLLVAARQTLPTPHPDTESDQDTGHGPPVGVMEEHLKHEVDQDHGEDRPSQGSQESVVGEERGHHLGHVKAPA